MTTRVLAALFAATVALGRAASGFAGADELLLVLDLSASMSEPTVAGGGPRFALAVDAVEATLRSVPGSVDVGLVSVGGACGAPPQLELPVGTPRRDILRRLRGLVPAGPSTDLDLVLQATPARFHADAASRELLVVSDGLDGCSPAVATCDVVRRLHAEHGIVTRVAAVVMDEAMRRAFACVGEVGGTFTVVRAASDVVDAFAVEVWPYVVLAAGALATMLGARIAYRHAVLAHGAGAGAAASGASLLALAAIGAVYLVLFGAAGWGAAVVALAVAGGGVGWAASCASGARGSTGTAGLSLAALIALGAPSGAAAAPSPVRPSCRPERVADVLEHHFYVDGSRSVRALVPALRGYLESYLEQCARPGDTVVLVPYAVDASGGVATAVAVPLASDGSAAAVLAAFDGLALGQRPKTRTLFHPLPPAMRHNLRSALHDVVVLVWGDGVSDDPRNDIRFEHLGRTLYAAGKARFVAVETAGLDLGAVVPKGRDVAGEALLPDPCLLAPAIAVSVPRALTLEPSWTPWGPRSAPVEVSVQHRCAVRRHREIELVAVTGDRETVLGRWRGVVSDRPTAIRGTLTLPRDEVPDALGLVAIVEPDGRRLRVVPAGAGATTRVRVRTYLGRWAWPLGLGAAVLVVAAGVAGASVRRHVRAVRRRRLWIEVPPCPPVLVRPAQTVTLGGDGAQLVAPGVPAGTTLASLTFLDERAGFRVVPRDGVALRILGNDQPGPAAYRLGQPMELVLPDGSTHEVTVHAGRGDGATPSGAFGDDPLAGAPAYAV